VILLLRLESLVNVPNGGIFFLSNKHCVEVREISIHYSRVFSLLKHGSLAFLDINHLINCLCKKVILAFSGHLPPAHIDDVSSCIKHGCFHCTSDLDNACRVVLYLTGLVEGIDLIENIYSLPRLSIVSEMSHSLWDLLSTCNRSLDITLKNGKDLSKDLIDDVRITPLDRKLKGLIVLFCLNQEWDLLDNRFLLLNKEVSKSLSAFTISNFCELSKVDIDLY